MNRLIFLIIYTAGAWGCLFEAVDINDDSLFFKLQVLFLVLSPIVLFVYTYYKIFKGCEDISLEEHEKKKEDEYIDFTPHPDYIKYRKYLDKKRVNLEKDEEDCREGK